MSKAMKVIILATLWLVIHGPARASDETGLFAIKGAGLLECKLYVAAREQRTEMYYMIAGWMDGFVTAHNKYMGQTYDVTAFESSELLAGVVENHCRVNPNDRMFAVVNTIVMRLHDQRVENAVAKVPVVVGDRSTRMYRATVAEMQAALFADGHYKGEADGSFDEQTMAAVRSYQASLGFEATGFPDQVTLWRLFRKAEGRGPS